MSGTWFVSIQCSARAELFFLQCTIAALWSFRRSPSLLPVSPTFLLGCHHMGFCISHEIFRWWKLDLWVYTACLGECWCVFRQPWDPVFFERMCFKIGVNLGRCGKTTVSCWSLSLGLLVAARTDHLVCFMCFVMKGGGQPQFTRSTKPVSRSRRCHMTKARKTTMLLKMDSSRVRKLA